LDGNLGTKAFNVPHTILNVRYDMAICPICTDENSANLEHTNFHQINRPDGHQLQANHQDHWACKPCADLWLQLSNRCIICRDFIPQVQGVSGNFNFDSALAILRDISNDMPAGQAIERHGVTAESQIVHLRYVAAQRDIDNGMPAGQAIERHGVIYDQQNLRSRGAQRDINNGMFAGQAIERHGVTDGISQAGRWLITYYGAKRDINNGMPAGQAIERHGVTESPENIRFFAVKRDINNGMPAGQAIEHHGVTESLENIRSFAVQRDIDNGMPAGQAIERHRV
jgi:hypothetical protein